jgi:hypothetical protein
MSRPIPFSAVKKALALAALLGAGAAHAELPNTGLPYGTLTFIEPHAVVQPGEQIDVWVRFTLAEDSQPLDLSVSALEGFAPESLPTIGYYYDEQGTQQSAEFVEYFQPTLNSFFVCTDTFSGGCNGDTTNYSYTFFLSSEEGRPSINDSYGLILQPGESFEYVFARFTPAEAGAAPGTYQFFTAGLLLDFYGLDAAGNHLSSDGRITLAQTCSFGQGDCGFTRVVEVPEPQTYGMLLLGLAMVGGLARRAKR